MQYEPLPSGPEPATGAGAVDRRALARRGVRRRLSCGHEAGGAVLLSSGGGGVATALSRGRGVLGERSSFCLRCLQDDLQEGLVDRRFPRRTIDRDDAVRSQAPQRRSEHWAGLLWERSAPEDLGQYLPIFFPGHSKPVAGFFFARGPGAPRTYMTALLLPLPFVIGLFAPLPLVDVILIRRRRRRGRRLAAGLCVRCGYDLRASPDRCPECGAVPAAVNSI